MPLTDTRIIARQSADAGAHQVLAQRHEILWRDGTSCQLHPVQRNDMPLLLHRALEAGAHLVLVDLAQMVSSLAADMRMAPPRDHVGTVWMALRLAYSTAADFAADARRHSPGSWQRVDDGWVWLARPRQVDAHTLSTAALAAMQPLPLPRWPQAAAL